MSPLASSRRVRRPVGRLAALLSLLLGCLVFSGFASLSPARGDGGASSSPSRKGKAAAKPRVVLVLTGGLRWDQLDQTIAPNLARLGASGTMANLVPVSTTRPACPVDTWLAMSAGRQISSGGVASTPTCTQPLVAAGAPLPEWGRYRAALAQTSKRSHLGQFAELASKAGISTHGIGNGAAYTLAGPSGVAPANYTAAPGADEELSNLVSASASSHDLTVVDADTESYASDEERKLARSLYQQERLKEERKAKSPGDWRSDGASDPAPTSGASVSPTVPNGTIPPDTVDGSDSQPGRRIFSIINMRRVERILQKIPSGTRVMLVSAADIDTYTYMQMYVAADVGKAPGAPIPMGLASSDSVRQKGIVQATDVVPTVLSWFGADRGAVTGSVIGSRPNTSACSSSQACYTERVDTLADQARHSGKMRTLRGPFIRQLTTASIVFFLVSLALTAMPLYRRVLRHRSLSLLWSWLGLTIAAVPLASLVVNVFPWWMASNARLALFAGCWATAGALAALALATGRFWAAGPLLSLAVPTAAFIALDAATGSHIMADSVVGFNLLTAARFYGVGNEAYALLAAGTLLGLAFLGERIRLGRPAEPAREAVSTPEPALAHSGVAVRRNLSAGSGGPTDRMVPHGSAPSGAEEATTTDGTAGGGPPAGGAPGAGRPSRTGAALAAIALIGLAVAGVDALPSMGADFGGVLSFLPALFLLMILVARIRLSVSRILTIGGITVAAAAAIAVLDWMRPAESRTHLGKFVQSISDGELAEVLGRKLGTNVRLLFNSTHRWVVLAGLVLFVCALVDLIRARPEERVGPGETAMPGGGAKPAAGASREAGLLEGDRSRKDGRSEGGGSAPGGVRGLAALSRCRAFMRRTWGFTAPVDEGVRVPLRMGLLSAGLCLLLAFALNDSGIVLPGMAVILVMPGLVALWLRQALKAREEADSRPLRSDSDRQALDVRKEAEE